MTAELTTLDLLYLSHAVGCYRKVKGYRYLRKELEPGMAKLHDKLERLHQADVHADGEFAALCRAKARAS